MYQANLGDWPQLQAASSGSVAGTAYPSVIRIYCIDSLYTRPFTLDGYQAQRRSAADERPQPDALPVHPWP